MTNIKKQILNSILEIILCISDKEYQKRVWIRGEGQEVDDFDETCCDFFGDGDPLIENHREFELTEIQYRILKKFRDEFRDFSNKNIQTTDFIETPEWNEIVELAKDVLKFFNFVKK